MFTPSKQLIHSSATKPDGLTLNAMQEGIMALNEYEVYPWIDYKKGIWEFALIVKNFKFLPGSEAGLHYGHDLTSCAAHPEFQVKIKQHWRLTQIRGLLQANEGPLDPGTEQLPLDEEKLYSALVDNHKFMFIPSDQQKLLDEIPEFKDGFKPSSSLEMPSQADASWPSLASLADSPAQPDQPLSAQDARPSSSRQSPQGDPPKASSSTTVINPEYQEVNGSNRNVHNYLPADTYPQDKPRTESQTSPSLVLKIPLQKRLQGIEKNPENQEGDNRKGDIPKDLPASSNAHNNSRRSQRLLHVASNISRKNNSENQEGNKSKGKIPVDLPASSNAHNKSRKGRQRLPAVASNMSLENNPEIQEGNKSKGKGQKGLSAISNVHTKFGRRHQKLPGVSSDVSLGKNVGEIGTNETGFAKNCKQDQSSSLAVPSPSKLFSIRDICGQLSAEKLSTFYQRKACSSVNQHKTEAGKPPSTKQSFENSEMRSKCSDRDSQYEAQRHSDVSDNRSMKTPLDLQTDTGSCKVKEVSTNGSSQTGARKSSGTQSTKTTQFMIKKHDGKTYSKKPSRLVQRECKSEHINIVNQDKLLNLKGSQLGRTESDANAGSGIQLCKKDAMGELNDVEASQVFPMSVVAKDALFQTTATHACAEMGKNSNESVATSSSNANSCSDRSSAQRSDESYSVLRDVSLSELTPSAFIPGLSSTALSSGNTESSPLDAKAEGDDRSTKGAREQVAVTDPHLLKFIEEQDLSMVPSSQQVEDDTSLLSPHLTHILKDFGVWASEIIQTKKGNTHNDPHPSSSVSMDCEEERATDATLFTSIADLERTPPSDNDSTCSDENEVFHTARTSAWSPPLKGASSSFHILQDVQTYLQKDNSEVPKREVQTKVLRTRRPTRIVNQRHAYAHKIALVETPVDQGLAEASNTSRTPLHELRHSSLHSSEELEKKTSSLLTDKRGDADFSDSFNYSLSDSKLRNAYKSDGSVFNENITPDCSSKTEHLAGKTPFLFYTEERLCDNRGANTYMTDGSVSKENITPDCSSRTEHLEGKTPFLFYTEERMCDNRGANAYMTDGSVSKENITPDCSSKNDILPGSLPPMFTEPKSHGTNKRGTKLKDFNVEGLDLDEVSDVDFDSQLSIDDFADCELENGQCISSESESDENLYATGDLNLNGNENRNELHSPTIHVGDDLGASTSKPCAQLNNELREQIGDSSNSESLLSTTSNAVNPERQSKQKQRQYICKKTSMGCESPASKTTKRRKPLTSIVTETDEDPVQLISIPPSHNAHYLDSETIEAAISMTVAKAEVLGSAKASHSLHPKKAMGLGLAEVNAKNTTQPNKSASLLKLQENNSALKRTVVIPCNESSTAVSLQQSSNSGRKRKRSFTQPGKEGNQMTKKVVVAIAKPCSPDSTSSNTPKNHSCFSMLDVMSQAHSLYSQQEPLALDLSSGENEPSSSESQQKNQEDCPSDDNEPSSSQILHRTIVPETPFHPSTGCEGDKTLTEKGNDSLSSCDSSGEQPLTIATPACLSLPSHQVPKDSSWATKEWLERQFAMIDAMSSQVERTGGFMWFAYTW